MNEVYLEIPISEIREMAVRSEIFIEPDAEEEDSSEDEEEEEEEEEEGAVLPDWEALAKERFLAEHRSLDEGVQVRVLTAVNVKINWSEGEEATWRTAPDVLNVDALVRPNEALQTQLASFNQRIKNMINQVQEFVKKMNDAGHELETSGVHEFLDDCLALEGEALEGAAE
jgi:hypothetical protein